jgi:hypothetical protein
MSQNLKCLILPKAENCRKQTSKHQGRLHWTPNEHSKKKRLCIQASLYLQLMNGRNLVQFKLKQSSKTPTSDQFVVLRRWGTPDWFLKAMTAKESQTKCHHRTLIWGTNNDYEISQMKRMLLDTNQHQICLISTIRLTSHQFKPTIVPRAL